MKNEIAKLVEAYSDLKNDVFSLLHDIKYIMTNKFKWMHYEAKKVEENCLYNSFYKSNDLLYTLVDLNDEIPYLQISLFHISDDNDENDDEVGLDYLGENWKNINPQHYLYDKNYEINKTSNGFRVIAHNREKYVFAPNIDLLSITSSNIIESDINNLISSLLNGTYEDFLSKDIKFIESKDE
jgi:hypothetical protein